MCGGLSLFSACHSANLSRIDDLDSESIFYSTARYTIYTVLLPYNHHTHVVRFDFEYYMTWHGGSFEWARRKRRIKNISVSHIQPISNVVFVFFFVGPVFLIVIAIEIVPHTHIPLCVCVQPYRDTLYHNCEQPRERKMLTCVPTNIVENRNVKRQQFRTL